MKAPVLSILLNLAFSLGLARTAGAQVAGAVKGYPSSPTGSALVRANDGYYYGTTVYGGANNLGSVFRFSPMAGTTTLFSFSESSDGAVPGAALTLGSDGNLYGTTSQIRGTNGGTVFRITTEGKLTTLHSFDHSDDGRDPREALLLGSDGNLYGTTNSGGVNGGGTVFKMTPPGVMTILYSFPSYGDYAIPGKIVQGKDGDLYGTTNGGDGTVFKITTTGVLITLHVFDSSPVSSSSHLTGPFDPNGLTLDKDGNFYGTTRHGGYGNGSGTIFKMTPAGDVTILHLFKGKDDGPDGFEPAAELVQGHDGNFYGVTRAGISHELNYHYFSQGTLFRITPAGEFTTLYSFGLDTRTDPDARLVQDDDGSFYGSSQDAGIYRLNVFALPATFFQDESAIYGGVNYLAFPGGNIFGYFSYLADPHYLYHFDLGYEYAFDAKDGQDGVYLYDFASHTFFYTSPTYGFPYLYDFELGAVLYYYPDPKQPGRYNTNGVRYFYNFGTGQIITK